jgi:hypothetical protein
LLKKVIWKHALMTTPRTVPKQILISTHHPRTLKLLGKMLETRFRLPIFQEVTVNSTPLQQF